jgi:hypothetical protein
MQLFLKILFALWGAAFLIVAYLLIKAKQNQKRNDKN